MTSFQQSDIAPNFESNPNGTIPLSNRQRLPTARTMLTTLIKAISAIPLLPAPEAYHQPADATEKLNREAPLTDSTINNNNPLRRVPPSHRHLLITLHVLFPGLVLPALDLLERGLVARVGLASSSGSATATTTTKTCRRDGSGGGERVVNKSGSGGAVDHVDDDDGRSKVGGWRPQDGDGEGVKQKQQHQSHQRRLNNEKCDEGEGGEEEASTAGTATTTRGNAQPKTTRASFYLVQSAASQVAAAASSRRRRKHSDDGHDGREEMATAVAKEYIVLLEAWHCSCAAFAFASVQGGNANSEWVAEVADSREQSEFGHGAAAEPGEGSGSAGTEMDWSFGGMSLDGLAAGSGEGVPLCKHLLACLLAERWSAPLGRYVVERRVGREEMAGIVAYV
ncbi:hypothetical protein N657DRAFT_691084 [Parathielavia appendiculata]|uniref:SWIM-type domain-containing protein n=1 Tax=Parathielavia appendiculata TaxID=2587402 RepID=A0AAN6TYF1_9PEZI|nr:hypothetical protein N657DRAFT_691084 [Parathielavia appendiculata]